ncbi:MAG: anaerobic ribonucleoside-triphosphate reductase activating protein [Bacteroides sp.]|nr:anaerobic ribonucleoside-triphosphate reductase activating protein [Bacteroides sp.]MBQ8225318.1 anaerobic ribonucleoside-triphosphate reductase activating protein [Bacteroides sp.]
MLAILRVIEDTTVDGPGFRTSIYAAGCNHRCPGCHNPQSWDIRAGRVMETDELLSIILADPFADVTFTGGDPMLQAEGFCELARAIKQQSNKTIWCYTGYTFEACLQHSARRQLLQYVDVLVDGPYIEALRDETLLFRGSSNQRLIDVKKELQKMNQ